MLKKYLSKTAKRYASKWLVLFIDLVLIGVTFSLSYLIRFNFTLDFDLNKLFTQLPLVVLISLVAFLIIGSYKGVVRHTGVRDVYNIFNAISLSSILTIILIIINRKLDLIEGFTIPLSIIIIHSLLSFTVLSSSRYVFKVFFERFILAGATKNLKKILIYGAGDAGIMAHNAITNNSSNQVNVIGYIDRHDKKTGKFINGIPVYGKTVLTESFVLRKNISDIFFSIKNIEHTELLKLVDELVDLPVAIKIVPPVEDWINGELKLSQIKNVQIEDLLNRPPISFRNSKIDNELENKVILVTGAAGSIGSEISRQICKYNYKSLVLVDQAESALYDLQQELKQNGHHNFIPIVCDVRDKNRMNAIFNEYKPNNVFHAAAYKHVPLMEYNSYEAIKINIAGTKVIADLSVQYDVQKFVFVSTDKAVNPTNIMGATKRIAEMYISCLQQTSKVKFITTRFGNVLGSNGSVIPLFKKQIEKGGPLTVTHAKVTRFFMTIPEASQLVLEAGAMGEGGEIFIFDMGESVKIFDLAINMIKLSGLKYPQDIDIKITGLRPGEKLYEELLANGENVLPTYHKKIMIGKVRELDYSKVRGKIDELCVMNMFFNADTVKLMKEIVPEFISNNSNLCELDTQKKPVVSDKKGILQSS
tara:strand:- start:5997 stop:7934 length:1938 start_codon:yes stop_codon:yes gene_type:complete